MVAFFQKVVIKIKLTGKDIDDMHGLMNSIYSQSRSCFTEQYINSINIPLAGSTTQRDNGLAYNVRGYMVALEQVNKIVLAFNSFPRGPYP